MSEDIIHDAARFLATGAQDLGLRNIYIALHGGEPLMFGKARMKRCIETLRETIEPHTNLWLGVQTNGLLLDREWIALLARYGVSIGISIDGPQHINDAVRIDKKGGGTYGRVIAAVELLKDSVGDGTIPRFGALSVIHPGLNGRQAFDYMVLELGVRSFDFLVPQLNWDTYDEKVVSHVQRFYDEVLDRWLEYDDPAIEIRTLLSLLRAFLTDESGLYRLNYIASMAEGISIRSNGDVCPDDGLPPVNKIFRNTGCNVRTGRLATFYQSALWDEIRGALLNLPDECSVCKWSGFCAGGPLETRFSKEKLLRRQSIYCETYKSLFDKIERYVARYVGASVASKRAFRASNVLASLGAACADVR